MNFKKSAFPRQGGPGAFTLVELIVVITILAVLGTIAFISFQGYTLEARNSTRLADLQTINSALSLNQVRTGRFVGPSGGVAITFSGAEVWTQGTFGNETRHKLGNRSLTKVPVDPLTQNEYTYSVLNTRREISLAGVMEGDYSYNSENNLLLNKTYAAGSKGVIYMKGNYNGKVAKTQSGARTYILAVPSIISGDITLTDIITLLNSNKLVYEGFNNLPSSYNPGVFTDEAPNGLLVNTGNIVVFDGSINTLNEAIVQDELIDKLILAYSGTLIEDKGQIKEIINSTSGNKTLLSQTIIKNSILPHLEITASVSNVSSSNCDPDNGPCYINANQYVVSELYSDGGLGCKAMALTVPIQTFPLQNCILKIYQNLYIFQDYYVFPSGDISTMRYETADSGGWSSGGWTLPTNVVPVAEAYCNNISYGENWTLMTIIQQKYLYDNYSKYTLANNKQYWTSEFQGISSGMNKYYAIRLLSNNTYDVNIDTWNNTAFSSWSEGVICVSSSVPSYIN